jgi:hypothetical protein
MGRRSGDDKNAENWMKPIWQNARGRPARIRNSGQPKLGYAVAGTGEGHFQRKVIEISSKIAFEDSKKYYRIFHNQGSGGREIYIS